MQALRAFDAVARLGTVNAAAEELHLTHGAVSHQVRGLEDFIGTPLIDRKKRRQALTELGRVYAYQVRQTLDALAEITADIRNRTPAGQLRISVLPSLAQGWLVPRLPDWARRHPDVRLHFDGSMTFADFTENGCDCAIRFGHGQWPDLEVQRIMGDRLIVVASPTLFSGGAHKPTLSGILAKPRLQSSESWALWLNAIGSGEPLTRECSMTFTDSTHLLEAARNGLGVALTRASIAGSLVDRGDLLILDTPSRSNIRRVISSSARAAHASIRWLPGFAIGSWKWPARTALYRHSRAHASLRLCAGMRCEPLHPAFFFKNATVRPHARSAAALL